MFFPVFSVFAQNGRFRIYPVNSPFEFYFSKLKFLKVFSLFESFEKEDFHVFLSFTELSKTQKNTKNAFFGVFEKRKIELDSNRGLSFLNFDPFEILRCLTFGLILGGGVAWRTLIAPHILAERT